jgi:hypothetical protein
MLVSSGIIKYDTSDCHWVTVSVDQEILNYYYSLIPKYYRVIRPRWKAHVTVVRPEDNPTNLQNWGLRDGQIANFVYDPTILYEKGFWWFNLWSIEMEDIRKELGLGIVSRITAPPTGYTKCFHCTIAKDFGI